MYINGHKITKVLDSFAPIETQYDWDNSGEMIGNFDKEVDRILIALDVTPEVIDEAIEENCNLIITHHPLIFPSIKSVTTNDIIGKMIYQLIKHDIALLVAHTNLDQSEIGINQYICDALGAKKIDILSEKENLGVLGRFDKPLGFNELKEKIETTFNFYENAPLGHIRYSIKNVDHPIHTIAICSGEGSDFIDDAISKKADVYLTGDIKYHFAQYAKMNNLDLIDIGHYFTEAVYNKELKRILDGKFEEKGYDVNVIVSKENINPFNI